MNWFTTPKVFTAGQKAKAADVDANFTAVEEALNGLFKMAGVGSSSDLILTGAYQNVPGAAATVTVARASLCLVLAQFDFLAAGSSAGAGVCIGALELDGSTQAAVAHLTGFANATLWSTEATVGQVYVLSLDIGAHTLQLQAKKENVAEAECRKTNSRLSYLVLPNPEP